MARSSASLQRLSHTVHRGSNLAVKRFLWHVGVHMARKAIAQACDPLEYMLRARNRITRNTRQATCLNNTIIAKATFALGFTWLPQKQPTLQPLLPQRLHVPNA